MPKSVLVVEDQPELRQLVCLFLNHTFDVTLHEAADGEAALDILQSHPEILLVITDLNMPQLNGLKMTEEIRVIPEFKDLPIIMLTSEGESYREKAKQVGVTEFFNKPMNPDSLMPEVAKYL